MAKLNSTIALVSDAPLELQVALAASSASKGERYPGKWQVSAQWHPELAHVRLLHRSGAAASRDPSLGGVVRRGSVLIVRGDISSPCVTKVAVRGPHVAARGGARRVAARTDKDQSQHKTSM